MGTLNSEPQEYGRNIIEYKDPGRYMVYSYYIPSIFLGFPVWGSHESLFSCFNCRATDLRVNHILNAVNSKALS